MIKFTLIGLLCVLAPPIDYAQFYGPDYRDAQTYVRGHKNDFLDVAAQAAIEPRELSSILFPELIRYSLFLDFFETKALEMFYIENGAGQADFSIGRFQMKPSFAERVEAYVAQDESLRPYFTELLFFEKEDIKYRRRARIARLKDDRWQLIYAAALLKIAQHKFGEKIPAQDADRIRFLATVYNHGFQDSAEEIALWIPKENFPYGTRYQGPQHAYAEVAADFFEKYSAELMTP